jgi:glycolate oxidase
MAKWTNARKSVMSALSRYGEHTVSVSLADDMAVPISKIPDAVMAFGKIGEKYGVVIGTYGHAADGNLHTKMLLNPESPDSWRDGEKAEREQSHGHGDLDQRQAALGPPRMESASHCQVHPVPT